LVHGSFSGVSLASGDRNGRRSAVMPFKHNTARRHHIEKMNFRVANWPEYEAGLRPRGSLTLWLTPDALSRWQAPRRKARGDQHRYSDLAIDTALTRCLVFGLRLRQGEGLLELVLQLMGLALAVPDHTPVADQSARDGKCQVGLACSRRTSDIMPGISHLKLEFSIVSIRGLGKCCRFYVVSLLVEHRYSSLSRMTERWRTFPAGCWIKMPAN
jgi:hypothetical protein